MSKLFLVVSFLCFFQVSFSQTTYTFNGNGFWTVASNWSNNTIPPSTLTAGNTININPASGDSCVLNTSQVISAGANFNIFAGAIFIINGGVTITGTLPTVTTDSVFNVTNTKATCIGTIIANGGDAISAKGFVFDTFPNPSITTSDVIVSLDTFNTFYSSVTGFVPYKTYYFRAFATNSAGTGYGAEKTFRTWYNANNDSIFTDARDGQVYTYKHIGGQVWMTQNLNYVTDSSWCVRNDINNCTLYGRLYSWNDALIAAPAGWHLPSESEWNALVYNLGGQDIAGGKMKSTSSLWQQTNAGANNSSGFAALPGGVKSDTSFIYPARAAYFWSSTGYDTSEAMYVNLFYSNVGVSTSTRNRLNGLSVRCIRNDVHPSSPVIVTKGVSDIGATYALTGSIILSIGGDTITETGIVWDTVPGPSVESSYKIINSARLDTFSKMLYYLKPGKTYYVRAFARNSYGTGYGMERMFTTKVPVDSTFTDPRDGQVYTFRHIGTQVWMTQNLNYVSPAGSWCYNNDTVNASVYGRLYNWSTALTIAPPGWHLPSDYEWQVLINFLGGSPTAGGAMKSLVLWNDPNIGGTNSSGFAAIPGGYFDGNGTFLNLGFYTYWWSSSFHSFTPQAALARGIYGNSASIFSANSGRTAGYSVRLVRDH